MLPAGVVVGRPLRNLGNFGALPGRIHTALREGLRARVLKAIYTFVALDSEQIGLPGA